MTALRLLYFNFNLLSCGVSFICAFHTHCGVGSFAVCDCSISWSYSLIFIMFYNAKF